MRKYDIVNALAAARGQARYLEICTPTTGARFGRIDPDVCAVRRRLMYRCPDTYDDGMEIAFRTANSGSGELIRALLAVKPDNGGYDIVFVDPWHSYEASLADLHGAYALLRPGGVLVVHDCNPEDSGTVGAEWKTGSWCGLTYRAFIDFALSAGVAGHCVVDCDEGCGVVFSDPASIPSGLRTARPDPGLVFEWIQAQGRDEGPYAMFDAHRARLLNLVSPLDFIQAAALPWPVTAPEAVNMLVNPRWRSGLDGWRCDETVEASPAVLVEDGAPALLLRGPMVAEGIEVNALWAVRPGDGEGRAYDAAYPVVAGTVYEARLRVLPRMGVTRLLLLFVNETGEILASHQEDATANGPGPVSGWRRIAVRVTAPPGACYATVLLRLIGGPGLACPAALVCEAVLGQGSPDPASSPEDATLFRALPPFTVPGRSSQAPAPYTPEAVSVVALTDPHPVSPASEASFSEALTPEAVNDRQTGATYPLLAEHVAQERPSSTTRRARPGNGEAREMTAAMESDLV